MRRFVASVAFLVCSACGGGGGGAGISMLVENQYDLCLVRMIAYAVPEPPPIDDFKLGGPRLPQHPAVGAPAAVADFNPPVPYGSEGEARLALAPGWYRIDLVFVGPLDEGSGFCDGDPATGEVVTVVDEDLPFHLTGSTSCVTTVDGPGSIHMVCVTPK